MNPGGETPMGYCINMTIDGVRIPKANREACRQAILAMFKDGNSYSWVSTPKGNEPLVKLFDMWMFSTTEKDPGEPYSEDASMAKGDLHIDYYQGEKMGSEAQLFEAIAPFIEPPEGQEATIEIRGEDGERWRFLFKNGKAIHQNAEFVWKDSESI
jgi:hypothetical protein